MDAKTKKKRKKKRVICHIALDDGNGADDAGIEFEELTYVATPYI
jgi:hypothetical protein